MKVQKAADGAQTKEFKISLRPGAYKLRFHPDGDRRTGYFSFQTRRDIAVTLRDFLSPKMTPSPRLYFFVPHGLAHLVMYYPLGDFNGVLGFQVLDPTGKIMPITFEDSRRVQIVDVPPGQDGKVWSINRSVSPDEPFKMLNAPQAFALSPDLVMTSTDALSSEDLMLPH